ncbi:MULTISPECIES: hypothetical protein [unclassified Methylobacterium]|uniref:hypothetical protein n=1 Tax=unclassified Methylobacterium TaxID=2615210 RepID=UPI00226A026D|nr:MULTISPECIES: hypothetical protein [unclassified Methylobacterium]
MALPDMLAKVIGPVPAEVAPPSCNVLDVALPAAPIVVPPEYFFLVVDPRVADP